MNNGFWKLVLSQFGNSLAINIVMAIVTWDLIANDKSPEVASSFLAVLFVSKIGFSIVAGPLADSHQRIAVFRAGILTTFFVCIFLVISRQIGISGKYAYIFSAMVLGFPYGTLQPISSAIIASLVKQEEIPKAYRRYYALQSSFQVVGIAVGMLSLQSFGVSRSLFLPLLCAFFGAASVFATSSRMDNSYRQIKRSPYLTQLTQGFSIVFRYKTEFYWNIAAASINSAIMPFVGIGVPTYVALQFHHRPVLVAIFEGLIALGGFFGSTVLLPRLKETFVKRSVQVRLAVGMIGISILVLAVTNNFVVWCGCMFILGIAIVTESSIVEAKRSMAIPDSYRGRVQLIHGMAIQSVVPLGFMAFGLLLKTTSISLMAALTGLVVIATSSCVAAIPGFIVLLDTSDQSVDGAYERMFPNSILGEEATITVMDPP